VSTLTGQNWVRDQNCNRK